MDAPSDLLARLFEGAPSFVARLREEQVESWTGLLDRAETIALAMPEEEQLELLNAHPRIGADPARVSALSFREQGYDHDPGTTELGARLDRLNDEYERRFGFRCVIFVNGRPWSEIADVIEVKLGADREEEKRRALTDVVAIARRRLIDLGNR
jgi:2-oxo-4-hydroxy-4-carboxy--5-ureidoimidazoline (OHCU) decarboxylase